MLNGAIMDNCSTQKATTRAVGDGCGIKVLKNSLLNTWAMACVFCCRCIFLFQR